ncbi:GrpB family protein [Salinibacterium sp. ZJ450]|uniref:GrpB family protein n=1 Tax=Salinibacterium sp. ZJ450 TaxID=2708338 RepID=UPI001422BBA1|nr:GrpB family protein [Salinibacterium sp. ZJ450]
MGKDEDAQLDAVLIGGREQRPIVIVDHDSDWAEHYGILADRIAAALGPAALYIEHIGSTAVPGLPAKPIIDILLIVNDVENDGTYVPALEAAGFQLRVRESGHRMLRTPGRDTHIHVLAPGAGEIDDYLDLRDWLRVSTEDRTLYASTKRQLADRQWSDANYYAEAKTEVVQQILAHARVWRECKSP